MQCMVDPNRKPSYTFIQLAKMGTQEFLDKAQLMLDNGQADINEREAGIIEGATALYRACEEGEPLCVRWILEHGADMLLETAGGHYPFHIACARGHIECVKLLVEHAKSINKLEEMVNLRQRGRTPFFQAVVWEELAVAKYLLEELQCDPSVKDDNGLSVFAHCKADRDYKKQVKWLKKHGVKK